MLGPEQCFFGSFDDKCRVALGLPAANEQAPIRMHLQYKVKLPDHDWVVAEKHKLIPSVYTTMVIEPNRGGDASAVTYSGPTYIAL